MQLFLNSFHSSFRISLVVFVVSLADADPTLFFSFFVFFKKSSNFSIS